jgi:hypothetical protein
MGTWPVLRAVLLIKLSLWRLTEIGFRALGNFKPFLISTDETI